MSSGGLAFWLDYVESRGGLWESAGDSTIVMIPPQLQHRHGLPEEFAVTAHPDVAREDGLTLLGAGHPLLAAAAEEVLSADDAGVLILTSPASRPPDDYRLLARARETFHVEHGRIDASGPAERALRQVLRIGVLVTYAPSADEVFHERTECWVDVTSRRELPGPVTEEMRRHLAGATAPTAPPGIAAVPAAIAAAHRLLGERFAERCQTLASGSARAAAAAELARAQKYYAAALASLARRQAGAAADRQALLAARADAVRAEERRRLAEIEEKYAPRHDIRPYRLHLLLVPVLRLPVDVLRGARRFPLALDWMMPTGTFAPVNCPACGTDTARSPLAAAKTGLGCASCLAAAPAEPTRAAVAAAAIRLAPAVAEVPGGQPGHEAKSSSSPATPAPVTGQKAGQPPPRPPSARPVPPAAKRKAHAPQALGKAGERVAVEFWSATAQGNLRALRRLCAADTPADAVLRLYGAAGPAVAAGLAAGETPQQLTWDSQLGRADGLACTGGYLHTGRADYTYVLRWDPQAKLVCEVLPFGNWVSDRLPSARWVYSPGAARMFGGLPEPDSDLDPVAVRLWRKAPAAYGLPLTLRCLAAWWRIGDGPALLDGRRPSVLAAAIHRMVAYRAGQPGATHDAIAELYHVTPADTRAVTPLLQARLQLAPGQPW